MTTLADVIVPQEFAEYSIKRTAEMSPLLTSAAVFTDPTFVSFLNGGGQTVNVPAWNPLAQTESNVSDDSQTSATPEKIVAHADIAVRHNRNQHWTSMDLSAQLAGSDPIDAIATQQGDYWGLDIQKVLLSSLQGVEADNVANDGSDMVVDVGTDAVGTPTAAELISAENIIDAMQTMGDNQMDIALLAMHSVQMSTLNKLNLIDYIPDWRGEVNQPTYLGKPVIVNDQLTAIAGTNRTKYRCFLFGAGSLAWGETPARVPVAVDRDELKGSGGGQETLSTRRQFIIHPAGVKFTSNTMTGPSPTNAELVNPLNWDRVYPERKQVKMAFLITNG